MKINGIDVENKKTIYKMSQLSAAAYDARAVDGFVELDRVKNLNGYAAGFYAGSVEGQGVYVIAHRGTVLSLNTHIIQDINILFEHSVPMITDAVEYTENILRIHYNKYKKSSESLYEFYRDTPVIHVGHSLGAILAQSAALLARTSILSNGTLGTEPIIFTLDDPGLGDILEKYVFSHFNMEKIRSNQQQDFINEVRFNYIKGHAGLMGISNLVNACNPHTSNKYICCADPVFLTNSVSMSCFTESDSFPSLAFHPFYIEVMLAYHDKDMILSLAGKNCSNVCPAGNWIHGFVEGIRMLDFVNASEPYYKNFWNTVFDYCWNSFGEETVRKICADRNIFYDREHPPLNIKHQYFREAILERLRKAHDSVHLIPDSPYFTENSGSLTSRDGMFALPDITHLTERNEKEIIEEEKLSFSMTG